MLSPWDCAGGHSQMDSSPPIHPHLALCRLLITLDKYPDTWNFSLEISSFCLYPSLPTRLGEKAHPTKLLAPHLTKTPTRPTSCLHGGWEWRWEIMGKKKTTTTKQTNPTTTTKNHTYTLLSLTLALSGGSRMWQWVPDPRKPKPNHHEGPSASVLQKSGVSFPVGMHPGAP